MFAFNNIKHGLVNALEDLMPGAEHKYCVEHLHANLKRKGFKGKVFKDAYNYLEKINPKMWSRHAFFTTSCSDILLNNIAESFNAWLLEARDQPILSCMKTIKRQLMNRFDKKRVGVATSTNEICPKIVKKLDRNKKEADAYICHWSNGLQYEVDHSHEPRRVVNLEERTCGCGRWQLNSIPCPHAICAMYRNRRFPEDYISK